MCPVALDRTNGQRLSFPLSASVRTGLASGEGGGRVASLSFFWALVGARWRAASTINWWHGSIVPASLCDRVCLIPILCQLVSDSAPGCGWPSPSSLLGLSGRVSDRGGASHWRVLQSTTTRRRSTLASAVATNGRRRRRAGPDSTFHLGPVRISPGGPMKHELQSQVKGSCGRLVVTAGMTDITALVFLSFHIMGIGLLRCRARTRRVSEVL